MFGLVLMLRKDRVRGRARGRVLRDRACPWLVLRMLRSRRQKKFGAQFPDAIDIIVRSLRAGHPVPIAISMVAREMADPMGTEFGIVADEITYGADLETAMRNLYFRVGQDDLPLFVTAVAIQSPDRRQPRRNPGRTCPPSSGSASRCAARSRRWRRKAAPPRSSSRRCRSRCSWSSNSWRPTSTAACGTSR